jgi:opacity protein-like surface antigen
MKITKLTMIIGFTALCSCTAFAQDDCVSEGKMVIDAYYGYPYVVGAALKSASTGTDVSVSNTNHIGAKFEYMVSDKIGLGVDYTYARVTIKEKDIQSTAANGQTVTYYGVYSASLTKQRILVRMNVHFATSPKIDPYVAFGVGYKMTTYKDNYPSTYDNGYNLNLLPVAYRIGIGMRFFFVENVGINIEAGLGGPAMQGGVSFKF